MKFIVALIAIIFIAVLGDVVQAHTGWDVRYITGFWGGAIWALVFYSKEIFQ